MAILVGHYCVNILRPLFDLDLTILGIKFPSASLTWRERKLWMFLLPVAIISIGVNVPEIHHSMGHFIGFKVSCHNLKTSSLNAINKIINIKCDLPLMMLMSFL